jgi:hypothetical protein
MSQENQMQASIRESISDLIGDISKQLKKTTIPTVEKLFDDLHGCLKIRESLNLWLKQLRGINLDELREACGESFIEKFKNQILEMHLEITQKQDMIEQELKLYQSIVSFEPAYHKCGMEDLAAPESPVEKGYSSDDELVLALEASKMSHIETRQYHQTRDDMSCFEISDLRRRLLLHDIKIQELRQRLQVEVEKNRYLQSTLDSIRDLLRKSNGF